jgi:tetratricopeptide (TPR) repeat protein
MWNQEPWFDRSHNVFFDWLIAGGALGLLAYLSMFGSALFLIWFGSRRSFSVLEKSILTGTLAGYFVHNIFVFDNLTSYIVFFAILAFVHAMNVAPEESTKKGAKQASQEPSQGDLLIIGAVIVAVTIGANYWLNFRNIDANRALIAALRPETALKVDAKGNQKLTIEDVVAIDAFGRSEAREQLGQIAFQTLDPRASDELRQYAFNLAEREFKDELERDPENLRIRSFLATFYARFGRYAESEEQFEKAIALSPTRQSVFLDYGMMLIAQGKYDEAESRLRTAYDLEQGNPDAQLMFAIALIYTKQFAQAAEIEQKFAGTLRMTDSRLINAYGNVERFDRVVALIGEKIAAGQMSGRDYVYLAGAYAALGDREKAIEALEQAKALDASLAASADDMIKEIRAGR